MGKSDLLKDCMKGGLDGLLSPTAKSRTEKQAMPISGKKEPAGKATRL